MNPFINYLSIVLITGLFFSCAEEKKESKKIVRPVKYQSVGYLGGEEVRTFSGTAQTERIINLSFRNTGIITYLDLNIGQQVKKGQLLARLDNVQSRLAYEQSLAQLNSFQSQMNTAKLSLDRVRSLYEKGSSSLSDYESAKNSYKTAQESFQSAKRSVAIQNEKVKYGYLYAPEDGVIAAVNSEIDENVNAGQSIAIINAGADMEIFLGLPESVINGVRLGMAVTVNFSSLSNKEFDAVVTQVSPSVDRNSATYPVVVTILNPSDEIKSGMAANVTFDFGGVKTNNDALVVPAHAVGEDSQGHFVFTIEINDQVATVNRQSVSIGVLTSERFQVISGLSFGQLIATAGLQTLLDGQEVRLQ